MAKRTEPSPGQWVFLFYRLPRQPSTPRITVWRNLNRLGVGKLNDGAVALPADVRTREQLEWVAEQVTEFGGDASIWLAHPATLEQVHNVAAAMAAERASEYQAVIDEATRARGLDQPERRRITSRLAAELQRIERRDYFPPLERDRAQSAVDALRSISEVGMVRRRARR
jgi:DNA-binding transcriptional regulator PaaX